MPHIVLKCKKMITFRKTFCCLLIRCLAFQTAVALPTLGEYLSSISHFKISQLFYNFLRSPRLHILNDKNWQIRMYCFTFINSKYIHTAGTQLPLTKTAALEYALKCLMTTCSALGCKEIEVDSTELLALICQSTLIIQCHLLQSADFISAYIRAVQILT